jgi:hypothetical protein
LQDSEAAQEAGTLKEVAMNGHNSKREEYVGTGLAIGAGGGVALGVVMMTIFDNPGFLAVGSAIGVAIGIAIGLALAAAEGGDDVND